MTSYTCKSLAAQAKFLPPITMLKSIVSLNIQTYMYLRTLIMGLVPVKIIYV